MPTQLGGVVRFTPNSITTGSQISANGTASGSNIVDVAVAIDVVGLFWLLCV